MNFDRISCKFIIVGSSIAGIVSDDMYLIIICQGVITIGCHASLCITGFCSVHLVGGLVRGECVTATKLLNQYFLADIIFFHLAYFSRLGKTLPILTRIFLK